MASDIGKTIHPSASGRLDSRVSAPSARRHKAAVTAADLAADDSVSLTASALTVQQAFDALAQTPAVRADLVEHFRIAIEDGSYSPDAGRIADRMISLEIAVTIAGMEHDPANAAGPRSA